MKKLNFSQMLESYKTSGLKSLSTLFVNEEASEEEFNAELEKAKKKAEGKEKSEVAKASVQAVQNEVCNCKEEVESVDESSKEKLTDYIAKASRNLVNLGTDKASAASHSSIYGMSGNTEKSDEESAKRAEIDAKSRKRASGITLAALKLKRKIPESVELDERVGGFGSSYSRSEKEAEIAYDHEGEDTRSRSSQASGAHSVHINGKKWKTFGTKSHAMNVAKKIKGATVVREEVELDEARKPSPITGTRKIASFEGDHGHTAEVRYHPDWNEYQVHHYKDGKHLGEKNVSYHGDDKQDAIDTAKHEVGINEQFDKSKVDTEQLKAEHEALLNVNTPSAITARKAITAELEKRGISESCLSPEEKEEKEKIVKGMKKNLSSFKERYGNRAKEVMYATATKNAQGK